MDYNKEYFILLLPTNIATGNTLRIRIDNQGEYVCCGVLGRLEGPKFTDDLLSGRKVLSVFAITSSTAKKKKKNPSG